MTDDGDPSAKGIQPRDSPDRTPCFSNASAHAQRHYDARDEVPTQHDYDLPRSAIRSVTSRTILRTDIDVSRVARRHSRVTSSMMLSTKNRRPDAS